MNTLHYNAKGRWYKSQNEVFFGLIRN